MKEKIQNVEMTCQPIQPRHLLAKLCNIFFQQGRHVTSSGSIWLKSRREEANLKPLVEAELKDKGGTPWL